MMSLNNEICNDASYNQMLEELKQTHKTETNIDLNENEFVRYSSRRQSKAIEWQEGWLFELNKKDKN